MAPNDPAPELKRLEADLKRLEIEYNMFFGGRLPRPPWETRKQVETLVKQCDRMRFQNHADRFRFSTLQSRYMTFIDLWDRALRAREEGRPDPFFSPPSAPETPPAGAGPQDRTVLAASFDDPIREIDKLQDLYHAVTEARSELGEESVPFHRFAQLIRDQVQKMKADGSDQVAFRVELKEGKVRLTARAVRSTDES